MSGRAISKLRREHERAKQQAITTLGTLKVQVDAALAALHKDVRVNIALFNTALIGDAIGRYNLTVELLPILVNEPTDE